MTFVVTHKHDIKNMGKDSHRPMREQTIFGISIKETSLKIR